MELPENDWPYGPEPFGDWDYVILILAAMGIASLVAGYFICF